MIAQAHPTIPPSTPPKAPSRTLHRLVLLWVAVPFVLFWLPLVRSAMDDPTYQWGSGWWEWDLGGTGLEGDLWYLALGTALGAALLWSGARAGRFFRWAAPVWMLLLLSRAVYFAVTNPHGFVFYGDTLGLQINMTWLSPTFHLVGLGLIALWLSRWEGAGQASRGRTGPGVDLRRILVLAALLPVQFVLLRFGEPHGATDAAGVLLTIGQWLAVPWALGPRTEGDRTPSA